eukprot:279064-Pleurochrysis_carterae.AAC.1
MHRSNPRHDGVNEYQHHGRRPAPQRHGARQQRDRGAARDAIYCCGAIVSNSASRRNSFRSGAL